MSVNNHYPGKPNYCGPTTGCFTLLHHEGPLVEWSSDVMKRVRFIQNTKVKNQRAIRLRHIVYVPKKMLSKKLQKLIADRQKLDAGWQKLYAGWQKLDADWQKLDAGWQKLDADWQKLDAGWQKADADKLLAYLHKHVKDCKWNGKELVFK